jgi:hypothetical protein
LGGFLSGCQKQDSHPPFLPGCETNCPHLPGIGVNLGGTGSPSDPASDAGSGTLTGQVLLLNDDSFVHATLYANGATIAADGASGSPVTGIWDGADPFMLTGVAGAAINWVGVKPDLVGGDPLLTYWGVPTNAVDNVDLGLASGTVLDGIFTALIAIRSQNLSQVVLFLHSAGTGLPLAGLHVAMAKADLAAYKSTAGWILDDGTVNTDSSGLVMFGNVDPANSAGTQLVTVVRAATSTSQALAAGQFAVRVVQGAVTLATVNIAL